jgi:hypothetical protein
MTNQHLFFGMQKLFIITALSEKTIFQLRLINFLTRHEKLTRLVIPVRFPTKAKNLSVVNIITMIRNVAAASRSSMADVYDEIFGIMIKRMVLDAAKKFYAPD